MHLGDEDGDVLDAVAEELEFSEGGDGLAHLAVRIVSVDPHVLVVRQVEVPPLCYLKFLVQVRIAKQGFCDRAHRFHEH